MLSITMLQLSTSSPERPGTHQLSLVLTDDDHVLDQRGAGAGTLNRLGLDLLSGGGIKAAD